METLVYIWKLVEVYLVRVLRFFKRFIVLLWRGFEVVKGRNWSKLRGFLVDKKFFMRARFEEFLEIVEDQRVVFLNLRRFWKFQLKNSRLLFNWARFLLLFNFFRSVEELIQEFFTILTLSQFIALLLLLLLSSHNFSGLLLLLILS
jgi:hypothetical protein